MTFLRAFRGELVTGSVTTAAAAGPEWRQPRRTEGIVDCSRANAWVVTRDVKSELFTSRATYLTVDKSDVLMVSQLVDLFRFLSLYLAHLLALLLLFSSLYTTF